MSFFELSKKSFAPDSVPFELSRTKLSKTESVVNGVIVPDYKFERTDPDSDPRVNLYYQDLCLGNLRALGQLDKLNLCVLQKDDVDIVIDSLSNASSHESV